MTTTNNPAYPAIDLDRLPSIYFKTPEQIHAWAHGLLTDSDIEYLARYGVTDESQWVTVASSPCGDDAIDGRDKDRTESVMLSIYLRDGYVEIQFTDRETIAAIQRAEAEEDAAREECERDEWTDDAY
jgi:hypothetical protein